jgi:hypothetical protein
MMRAAVKETVPDALQIVEVCEDATTKISFGARRSYALAARWTGDELPLPRGDAGLRPRQIDAAALRDFLVARSLSYPRDVPRLMNLLDSTTRRASAPSRRRPDGSDYTRRSSGVPADAEQNGAARRCSACALRCSSRSRDAMVYTSTRWAWRPARPVLRAPYKKRQRSSRLVCEARRGAQRSSAAARDAALPPTGRIRCASCATARGGGARRGLARRRAGGLHPALADFRASRADAARSAPSRRWTVRPAQRDAHVGLPDRT